MEFHKSSMRKGISASALALALVMAAPAQAQSDTSGLEGHVDGAAVGTEVIATDTHTGQKATGKVNESGDYEIFGLRPSTYRVEVAGKPAQETTLFIGQTGVVDFYETSAQIVVSGRALREVRTASVSTNVTPAQIENLPQNQRNFLDFANLAPGVTVAPGSNHQLQAGAIASSNTNVLLDGMSLKNPINHGGVFGQNFGLGNPFPQIAVQEYNVETQNFSAETGQAGAAVIHAVTKTGGDEFHGTGFIQFQPNWLIEQPYFDKKNGFPKPAYNRKQFGGDFGGPIIPGKLTFYVAGEGTIQNLPGLTGNVTVPIPQNLASGINITHNNDFKQGLYFGKLTWYAGDNDTVNLSAFIRRENNLSDIDGNSTSSHGRTIKTNQDRYQFQWKHSGEDWYNTLNISYDKGGQSTPSVGTGPEFILSSGTSFDEIAKTGAHFFEQGDSQKLVTIKDDVRLRRGEHTIQLGGHVSFMNLSRTVTDHFNGSYYYVNPGAVASFDPNTATPYGARINLTPTNTLNAKNTQIGLYLQDEWKPDDHWTVRYGLRWDFETNANNNNYVTPTAIVNALASYQGWQARGIDYRDYVSNGSNRNPQWDQFQPRVGVAYDVHGDRDLVLFGGAGRYYDRSLFIAGVIEQLTNTNKVVSVPFCSTTVTTGCVNFTNAMRDPDTLRAAAAGLFPGGGSVFLLNNKTKMPYSDQFDIGISKRFGDFTAKLTLAHIRSHNIFQFVRANFYTNGWYTRFLTRDGAGNVTGCTDGGDAWIQDFSPNDTYAACPAGGAQLSGYSGKLNRGVSDGEAHYTALYLTLEKPFTASSEWGFTTALTIQKARSNDAQELNSDEFWNGASQDAYGWNDVNGLEKWRLVTTANYRAPWGIQLAGTLNLSSGPSFGQIRAGWNSSIAVPDGACCYGNMGGPLNPDKFIGYKRFDLRIAKTFDMPFGAGHELTVDFQAYNVFNWLNRCYSAWGAGAGDTPPLTENCEVGGNARSFQAGIKYKF